MFTPNGPVNDKAQALLKLGMPDLYMPEIFTTPEDELLACRKTAWLGLMLNLSPVYDLKGKDVVKLLNYITVNRDYSNLKIGSSRHALMVNDKGQLLGDGVILRKTEDTYRTYWLAPVIAYYVDTLGYDVQGSWVFDEFFFQIDGPKSLEIMEKASQTDLHDLKFARNKQIQVAGIDCTIHRLGMSGCLAYEMHGNIKDAENFYKAICDAGEEFGLKRLGFTTYTRNHTQAGYPNQYIHYWYPVRSSGKELEKYIDNCPFNIPQLSFKQYPFLGSAADDEQNGFVTPFDIGWDYLINYDHEFIGKEALLEIKENPPRQVVTLEWDAEDVGKAFATQFMGTEVKKTDDIAIIGDGGWGPFVISYVTKEEKKVGIASGRTFDYYHRRMISLAFIDRDLAVEGTELNVVWGTDPEAAVNIKATVAAFPYYNEEYRNETFDVEKIPHPVFD